jgi:hypothetical protein
MSRIDEKYTLAITQARKNTELTLGIFSWQEFRIVVQTMRWEEMMEDGSDEKLAQIEEDNKRIRDLLSGQRAVHAN